MVKTGSAIIKYGTNTAVVFLHYTTTILGKNLLHFMILVSYLVSGGSRVSVRQVGAEVRAYNGSLQWGPGAEPLIMGSGDEAPEAKAF